MRDEDHLNELLTRLKAVVRTLRFDRMPMAMSAVEEAATQLRVLFDDCEDLAARLAEAEERERTLLNELDDVRHETDELRDTIAIQQEDL